MIVFRIAGEFGWGVFPNEDGYPAVTFSILDNDSKMRIVTDWGHSSAQELIEEFFIKGLDDEGRKGMLARLDAIVNADKQVAQAPVVSAEPQSLDELPQDQPVPPEKPPTAPIHDGF